MVTMMMMMMIALKSTKPSQSRDERKIPASDTGAKTLSGTVSRRLTDLRQRRVTNGSRQPAFRRRHQDLYTSCLAR